MRIPATAKDWRVRFLAVVVLTVSGYLAFAFQQTSSVTLDREKQMFVVDQGYGLLGHSTDSGPLASIAYATLETDTGAERFVLVFQGGERVGLGAYTDQAGQSEAVAAVNRFLQVGPYHE